MDFVFLSVNLFHDNLGAVPKMKTLIYVLKLSTVKS